MRTDGGAASRLPPRSPAFEVELSSDAEAAKRLVGLLEARCVVHGSRELSNLPDRDIDVDEERHRAAGEV